MSSNKIISQFELLSPYHLTCSVEIILVGKSLRGFLFVCFLDAFLLSVFSPFQDCGLIP